MRERLIVVGNGMVGLRFVEALLGRAPDRYHLTVIGKEPRPAYNRVLLSSLLAGEVTVPDVRFRDSTWYVENDVQLILGTPVERLDPGNGTVRLADGRPLAFDRLVIATGSQPIRPPIDLPIRNTGPRARAFRSARASRCAASSTGNRSGERRPARM